MEEAIARCQQFRKIGADITFLEAPLTEAEMRQYCSRVDGYKMANLLEGGNSPTQFTAAQLAEIGFTFAARPMTLLNAVCEVASVTHTHVCMCV